MTPQPSRDSDQRLLVTIQEFVAAHEHPGVRCFQDAIANWGTEWTAITPQHLPAADMLSETLSHTTEETHALVALFEAEKATRKWEQSYTAADNLVGDDMLAGYGFAEVIGKFGPFLSTRVRSGIGVWGPDIIYPPHRHQAEEVYVVLAGEAEFVLAQGNDQSRTTRSAGEVIHVPSLRTHGFRTRDKPLVVFYIWQDGELRQTSSFS